MGKGQLGETCSLIFASFLIADLYSPEEQLSARGSLFLWSVPFWFAAFNFFLYFCILPVRSSLAPAIARACLASPSGLLSSGL